MINRVRAALETYRTSMAFQIYVLALAPIIIITYLVSYIGRGDGEPSYLILVTPAVAIFCALLGEHMRAQFTSSRSRLVPDYVLPHMIAAVAVISIALLLVIPLSLGFYLLVPPHVSVAMLAAVWTISLAAFSAGYFFVPSVVFLLLILTVLNGSFIKWAQGMDRLTVAIVLAADLVLMTGLLKRVLSTTEESFEYRGKDTPGEFQRYMWTRFSKRTWINRLSWRREHVLDRPRPLSGDVMSCVRHFASGMPARQTFMMSAAGYVGVFWVLNLLAGSSVLIPDAIMLSVLPAMTAFMQTERGTSATLQSIFLLPLRREQIVSRYGLALLLVLLEAWLAFAVALIFLNWMPVPGKVVEFPSLRPFLISLVDQVPLFGLLGLSIGRSRVYIIGLTSLAVFLVALSSAASLQWVMVAFLISGPALIWLSYRRWCRAELSSY